MNIKLKKEFLLLIIIVIFSSCLSNVENPIEEVIEDPTVDPCEKITFSTNVKPIIDNNCIQCHGSSGNFPNLTSYNGISANAGIVNSAVSSKRMPKGGSLTKDEIAAINCWVKSGALNN